MDSDFTPTQTVDSDFTPTQTVDSDFTPTQTVASKLCDDKSDLKSIPAQTVNCVITKVT